MLDDVGRLLTQRMALDRYLGRKGRRRSLELGDGGTVVDQFA
jgi:hypothetical protein